MLSLFLNILSGAAVAHQFSWQLPPDLNVNIKPLGLEVGSDISQLYDLWLTHVFVSEPDPTNTDKIADLSYTYDFAEV
jgi:hypothetical protein